ncbi:Fic family protein [Candidatus Uhrbacteria bacterium]|nr:Fic family protein [Candidatus Uhrbacteria bacterium]
MIRFLTLTKALVIQLHRCLTHGLDVALGLRNQQVRITGTRYIPPQTAKLKPLFDAVVAAINHASYPPEKALIAACLIPYLQPFGDGNKRTGRMLANAILFAYDYYPFSYRNIDVTEYRKAIIVIYERTNVYHMKRLFMEQLTFSIDNYFR